jgi:hypothetical protein
MENSVAKVKEIRAQLDIVINRAKVEIEQVFKEHFFTNAKKIVFNRYIQVGETDYDTAKELKLENGRVYVYFPNYMEQYAWKPLTDLSIDKMYKLLTNINFYDYTL